MPATETIDFEREFADVVRELRALPAAAPTGVRERVRALGEPGARRGGSRRTCSGCARRGCARAARLARHGARPAALDCRPRADVAPAAAAHSEAEALHRARDGAAQAAAACRRAAAPATSTPA